MMRKAALFAALALVLMLAGCASSALAAPEEPKNDSVKTVEECIAQIRAGVEKTSITDYDIEQDGNVVTFTQCSTDASDGFRLALAGNESYVKAWKELAASVASISGNMHGVFERNGHPEIISVFRFVEPKLEPEDLEQLIYKAVDGKTVFDPVSGIDTEGLCRARAKEIGACFDGVIKGAKISTTGRFEHAEISLVTDWTADVEPDNWDEIRGAVLEAQQKLSLAPLEDAYVMICAGNGDILATFAGGRQTYDLYAKAEKQDDGELPPGVTVVSNGVVSQGSIDLENATLGEKNAYKKALQYLDLTAFSYDGLIEQLEYEKFSHSEAVFAADHCGADWYEQAAKKAESYLSISSFSRDRLIDQLVYEGFSRGQAEYGVSKVGY